MPTFASSAPRSTSALWLSLSKSEYGEVWDPSLVGSEKAESFRAHLASKGVIYSQGLQAVNCLEQVESEPTPHDLCPDGQCRRRYCLRVVRGSSSSPVSPRILFPCPQTSVTRCLPVPRSARYTPSPRCSATTGRSVASPWMGSSSMKTPTWLPAPCEGGVGGLGEWGGGGRGQNRLPFSAGCVPGSVLGARDISVNRSDRDLSHSKEGKTIR